MIARHWRGWTTPEDADAYEALLRDTVLPSLKQIAGYKGGYVLRREFEGEVEFIVLNFFESLEAVKKFAGPQNAIAVFEPEARRLLKRVEPLADHFDVSLQTL